MTATVAENQVTSYEPALVCVETSMPERGWQNLDGRPVGIWRGADNLVQVSKNAVVALVEDALNNDEVWQKGKKQVISLGEMVTEWAAERHEKVAGVAGAWRIQETNKEHKLSTIEVIFVIAQSGTNEIDESLWLDIARFDVQIAELPEFANIRVHFIPVPFMKQCQLENYLQVECRR